MQEESGVYLFAWVFDPLLSSRFLWIGIRYAFLDCRYHEFHSSLYNSFLDM